MGDGHHCAGVTLQKLLEPIDRFRVQVVGWLIKQQHVGFGQQQTAQGDTTLFTTRQQTNLGLPRRQTQGIGGNFQLVFRIGAGAANDGLHLGLLFSQRVKIGVFLTVGGVNFFQTGFGGEHITHAAFNAFAHGLIRVELRLLRQVANVEARHGNGLALKFLVHTRHDFQQRGFAGTIGAQHADLGAREETE